MSETPLVDWYNDPDTQDGLMKARRAIQPRDLPYLQLLLLAELYDLIWAVTPDLEEDEDEDEPWKA